MQKKCITSDLTILEQLPHVGNHFGLPRFSENLDFTLFKTNPDFKLKPYLSAVKQALESFGFGVTIEEAVKPER